MAARMEARKVTRFIVDGEGPLTVEKLREALQSLPDAAYVDVSSTDAYWHIDAYHHEDV